MSSLSIILFAIIIANSIFITRFIADLIKHRDFLQVESGNNITLALSSMVIFSFHHSVFAILQSRLFFIE